MWKITLIESDSNIKQGFESEDDAMEWLDRSRSMSAEDCKIEEMSEEEEEEFLDNVGDDEDIEESIEKYKDETANEDDDDDHNHGDLDNSLGGDDDLSEFSIHEGEDI